MMNDDGVLYSQASLLILEIQKDLAGLVLPVIKHHYFRTLLLFDKPSDERLTEQKHHVTFSPDGPAGPVGPTVPGNPYNRRKEIV